VYEALTLTRVKLLMYVTEQDGSKFQTCKSFMLTIVTERERFERKKKRKREREKSRERQSAREKERERDR
jgi:hypothetical protein